jgi:hypothetical protein
VCVHACLSITGDGFISLDEMASYLTSVFLVMDAIDPESFSGAGISPSDLADATAIQCFEEADSNQDGKLRWVCVRVQHHAPQRGVVHVNACTRAHRRLGGLFGYQPHSCVFCIL